MSTTINTVKIKCNCACHSYTHFRHVKHVEPCCNNGWIEIPEIMNIGEAVKVEQNNSGGTTIYAKRIEGPVGPRGNIDDIVEKFLADQGMQEGKRYKFYYVQLKEFLTIFAKKHLK